MKKPPENSCTVVGSWEDKNQNLTERPSGVDAKTHFRWNESFIENKLLA